ncbi:hypothetical protein BBC0244_012690 [Bartonella apihabitans]|nr:hypothetical protein BBC0244_012690 [Bartonella apihabitans]
MKIKLFGRVSYGRLNGLVERVKMQLCIVPG